MWDYDIEFAGSLAAHNSMFVVRRPDIPTPVHRYTEYSIPKKDGVLYVDDKTNDDIKIPVQFNFMGKPEEWFGLYRKAKKWLMVPGVNHLVFGDDKDYFYRVKKVEMETAERVCYEIGRFTAMFFCDGYHYRRDGTEEYNIADVLDNNYDTSMPVYKITGEGICGLTVNGNTVTANVGQNMIIDTGRHIAYRRDGTMQNTEVAGWYEDLFLLPGNNSITVTAGFAVKVIPNWRCT